MIKFPGRFRALFLVFLLAGCARRYAPSGAEWVSYPVKDSIPADSSLLSLLKPYSDSVRKNLEEVIAEVGVAMEKKQPEGGLGNLMADALLAMAREKFNTKVDAAFVNYGGVRGTTLMPGPLTRDRVFQMMPFNNLLMLQKMPGDTLQMYLNKMASYGGWPVSGITYIIENGRATAVKVNGAPLRGGEWYTIANSDYVINGGDNMPVLQVPTVNIGYLMRDALMEYFERQGRSGKPLVSTIENRVTHAK